MRKIKCLVVGVLLATAVSASAQELWDGLGVRGGIGSDITFAGVAFGAGVSKLFLDSFDIGLLFFYGGSKETSNNGVNTYVDTTKVTVFAAILNYLYGYNRSSGGFYFLAGAGLAYLGVNWEETSATDPTLGTPLPGGGSKMTVDGSTGGTVLNLGVGYAVAGHFDFRLEVPIIVAFAKTGGASTVIPLFELSAGYRFGP